jgi:beta-lactamase superfamily II metal-dependent hydrolase
MKSATKKKTAKKTAGSGAKKSGVKAAKKATTKKAAGKSVTIRMYNVGFGDAFLLTIPAKERPRKVLIDCGVHMSGPNPDFPISEVVQQIINDVTEPDGTPRIDLVIATHRHRDHVYGFANESWKTVEVREVWLPWTEDPKDPEAKVIRETQSKVAKKLHLTLTRLAKDMRLSAGKRNDAEQLSFFVSNSLTNAEAMEMLHKGFAGRPKRSFLPFRRRSDNSFETETLPGVTVHVLGPSRDKQVIRDMDPPKGQSYLRRQEVEEADDKGFLPFHADWAIKPEAFDPAHQILKPRELGWINNIGEDVEFAVAVALEAAVNGTSLMLLLQIGKAYLLFPGDAQWGTWKAALDDPDWRTLLGRTNFYKIGHHGSHNATPLLFVEEVLADDFLAMASVRPITKFRFIPKTELMQELRKKSNKVVRSDKADVADPPQIIRKDRYVEAKIPI